MNCKTCGHKMIHLNRDDDYMCPVCTKILPGRDFEVTWSILVPDQQCHLDAARQALRWMRSPDMASTIFDVRQKGQKKSVRLDAEMLDDLPKGCSQRFAFLGKKAMELSETFENGNRTVFLKALDDLPRHVAYAILAKIMVGEHNLESHATEEVEVSALDRLADFLFEVA